MIEDIAHALSHICRFGGHTREFYSVAQHSVMASQIVPEDDRLAGLLHDAAECYIGDQIKTLKQILPDYRAIEARIEIALFNKFGIAYPLPKSVKQADLVMLATEHRDLMPPDHKGCYVPGLKGIQPLASRIMPQTSKEAKQSFLDRYYALVPHEVLPC